jgi:hypothetical protein
MPKSSASAPSPRRRFWQFAALAIFAVLLIVAAVASRAWYLIPVWAAMGITSIGYCIEARRHIPT